MSDIKTPNNSNKAKQVIAVASGATEPAKPAHPVITEVEKDVKTRVVPALLDVCFSAAISAVGIGLSYLFFHDGSHATQFSNSVNGFKNVVQQSPNMNLANASYYQGSGYNYNGMYNQPAPQNGYSQQSRSVFDYKKISYATKGGADAVLWAMCQYMDQNSVDSIPVAKMYEFSSKNDDGTTNDLLNQIIPMMWHWGWRDLSGCNSYSYYDPAFGTVRYKISLPDAVKID